MWRPFPKRTFVTPERWPEGQLFSSRLKQDSCVGAKSEVFPGKPSDSAVIILFFYLRFRSPAQQTGGIKDAACLITFLRRRKNERLPFGGECEPPENVLRKFHGEKITNTAVLVVSAVGWLWAAGEPHTGPTAYRAHSACLDSIHRRRFISPVCTPSQRSSMSPLTPTRVKANISKAALSVFTSQTLT